jgi:regulator of sigma E protease
MGLMSFLGLPFFYVVPFIIALVAIIFVHELGHFLVGRWCGVNIETFAIGFGRELLGWNDRHGTRWKICALPFGGYVKFEGDANAASLPDAETLRGAKQRPGSYHGKPVWQRAAIAAAGPVANFLLAILIFAAVYVFAGVPMMEARIGKLSAGGAAEKAGLMAGDLITNINGTAISSFSDMQMAVVMSDGAPLKITYERAGKPALIEFAPTVGEENDGFGGTRKTVRLGIEATGALRFEKLGPGQALLRGVKQTGDIITGTLKFLGRMVTGHEKSDGVGGPVSMAKMAGDAASNGAPSFAIFIAFLSVSIGLLNLFPIPVLDGGHLVYFAIEAVLGRPLGQQAQEWGFRVGLSLILMLMTFAFWNDLTRVFNVIKGG